MSDVAREIRAPAAASDNITWSDIRGWSAFILAGSWTGYFLFTGMPQLTLHVFPRVLIMHVLVAAIVILYSGWLALARRLPGGTPLDLGVLALAVAYALGTVASINWRLSVEATLQTGIAVVAFYALADLPWLSARSLRHVIMVVGGALSVYALWVVGNDYANYLQFVDRIEGLGTDNIFPPTVPRVHDVSDHPNVLAMLLTLIMPFYALSFFRPASRWERACGLGGLLVGGVAIFLTLSRGGWMGVGAGVAVVAAGAWISVRAIEREERGEPGTWRSYVPSGFSPTALAAVAGALVLVTVGTLAFLSNSSTRPGWLFRSSLSPRRDAWSAGLDIFGDHPLFGAGPNTFGLLYPEHAGGNFLVHTQHAHNGFLQVANDAGIAGLLAIAVLAGGIIYMLVETWRRGALEHRLVAVACAGALIGFSLHNQLDAGNIWKAPGITLALVGALIVRNYRESPAGAEPRRLIELPEWVHRFGGLAVRVMILAVLVAPLLGWARIDPAHYAYWQGAEKLNKGEPGALDRLQDAVNADSSMTPYQLLLGQAQAVAYMDNGEVDADLLSNAIIHLERAVELDPRSDLAHANLAKAYQLAGRDDDAAREAQLTRLAVYHVPPVLAVGEVYELLGRTEDAVSTYAQVISMDSGLADSGFWQGTPFRRDHLSEIISTSSLGYNKCTFGAYLVDAHRSDLRTPLDGLEEAAADCRFLIFTSFPNDLVLRVNLAKAQMELGEADAAFEQLDFAVNRQPDFAPARRELGRWYQTQGNLDAARHQWTVGGQLEDAQSLLLLGNSYPKGEVPGELADRLSTLLGGSGTSIENDIVSILYYRLRYGRISPATLLIRGQWSTAVPRLYGEMRVAIETWRHDASVEQSAP